jgi:glyoxylase-like metal-dependent hydrolase (beta-lactamase superfamily II)
LSLARRRQRRTFTASLMAGGSRFLLAPWEFFARRRRTPWLLWQASNTAPQMPGVLPPFVEGLPDGVSRVSLPTPFRVGLVNCYLLIDPPVTLIDPGIFQPGSLDELATLLSSSGLGFGDVEQIVVTHAHPDHFGAAAAIAARSGARIVCGLPEVERLIGPRDPQSGRDLLVSLGVPEAMARSLVAFGDAALRRFVRRVDPSMVSGVRDGDVLVAGGRQLMCVLSSGHAEGHLSLWDPAARILFSGDHLLARIIPVPSLQGGDRASRRHSLVEYLDGLPRFVALDPTVVLPGHGRAFAELGVLAARLRTHSGERADDIAAILLDGPATPFDVARRLQWQPEGARLVLGLANAQGHLDLLEQADRVISQAAGPVVGYRLSA